MAVQLPTLLLIVVSQRFNELSFLKGESDDGGGGGSGTVTGLTSTGGTVALTNSSGPIVNVEANPQDIWSQKSLLGSAQRPATDLLMSAFDTNPATTDHTAAFNSALAAAKALITAGFGKVRILLDSRAKYTLGQSCVVGANNENAQVPLPFSTTVSGIIEICGMPGMDMQYAGLGQTCGTVIESTLGSAPPFGANGIASIFGSRASFRGNYGFGHFNYIYYSFRDIHIRSAAPVICGIDCGWVNGFFYDNLVFDTDQFANFPGGSGFDVGSITPCVATQACPIIFPQVNAYMGTAGKSLTVVGWTTGPYIGELLMADRMLITFVTGPTICVDSSYHTNRINWLSDWNNGVGIAAWSPAHVAGISPTGSGLNGGQNTGRASALMIGTWDSQRNNNQGNVAFNRTSDVLDANQLNPVDANITRIDADVGIVIGGYLVYGAGTSLTGAASLTTLREQNTSRGPQTPPSVPGSTTSIRNPFFRDSLVTVIGGTVTAITVNGVATGLTVGQIFVPACASISLTYTVAPTWNWQTF